MMNHTASHNQISIIGTCNYTLLGITSVLESLFLSKITRHNDLKGIIEKKGNTLIIAVLNENDINFNYIYHLKRRVSLYGGANLIILCDAVLFNILHSLFNISCTYVPINTTLQALQQVIIKSLLRCDGTPLPCQQPKLTVLESEILLMLSEGLSVSEISKIQKRDIRTISSHKYKLMRKMGMPNTVKSLSVLSMYLKSLYAGGHPAPHY
jgi:DNA-binding CsgD family transcriptional regulator